jgi:hypothetical protein
MPSGWAISALQEVVGDQAFQDFMRQPVGGGQRQLQRGFVGDAGAVEIGRLDVLFAGQRADLRPRPMRQDHPDIERAQHGHIQQDIGKILARHDPAINADDEDLLAEPGYVLQDFPQIGQFHNSDVTMTVFARRNSYARAAKMQNDKFEPGSRIGARWPTLAIAPLLQHANTPSGSWREWHFDTKNNWIRFDRQHWIKVVSHSLTGTCADLPQKG